MKQLLLISSAILLPLLPMALRADEEPAPPPENPPAAEAPQEPAYDADALRRWLESQAQTHGWPMTYKEDADLVVAGTCDAKTLEDGYKTARLALDKALALLKTDALDVQDRSKLVIVYLSKKQEYMAFAQDQAKARNEENLVKLLDTVPASGGFICLDPSYGVNDAARSHLTIHNVGHQILFGYAKHRGATPVPGWLHEGFPTWLESNLLSFPGACCVAKVGYDGDQFQKRQTDGRWDHVAYRIVRDFKDNKPDRKTGKPAYTRLGNLFITKLDRMTGSDVAICWHVVRDLAKRPDAFKTFLDAVLSGTKQQDAFKAAFKRSVDDYEKVWMKGLLDNPPEEPKKK